MGRRLTPAWERTRSDRSVAASDDEAAIESATTGALPIDAVWSHLLDVEFRKILIGADRVDLVNARQAKAGEGTEYRCWHGGRETTQLIVDWRSLERIVTRDRTKMGGATFTSQSEYLLEQVPEGTRLAQRGSVFAGPFGAKTLMRR